MNIPDVSVLLPCRNASGALEQALDSLLSQTLRTIEVVAVDDGSEDDTPEILEAFARRDARLRVFRRPHAGVAGALNTCLAKARGAYLARMDADDVCLPERLALQAAHLDADPAVGLVSCLVGFGGDPVASQGFARYIQWVNSVRTARDICLARFVESPLPHPSVMFRAELPAQHGGYRQGDFPEDYDLWLRWLEAGVRMEKLPRKLLIWNDPPTRLTRVDPRYDPDRFFDLKSGYLGKWLAANNPHHPEVALIGSSRTARRRALRLKAYGIRIRCYIDIDPRKVGRNIHGAPVIHRDELPISPPAFYLSYVGSRGAREEIHAFLSSKGLVHGRDFLFAA
ncbi:MAG: glycosyltransferase [Desulfovibrionaceae bacterium]